MTYALRAVDVSKHYPVTDGTVRVLEDLSLDLRAGEKIAIVGASGSGKSTLLNLLGGLDRPSSGTVFVGDQDLTAMHENAQSRWRNANLGFVFQFHHLMPEFSAVEAVAMPARIGGCSRVRAHEDAAQLLAELGLSERLHHRPSRLSGGERQRVAIARALINRPSCVLMDEPTGNLDPQTADQVLSLIHQLQFNETAFAIVTHDPEIAAQMDRQLVLRDGALSSV